MRETDVAIAGAGIAGLACAAELRRLGVRELRVLEAANRPGGAIETRRAPPFLIERGPLTVRGTPELEALAHEHGIALVRGVRLPPAMVQGGRLLTFPPPLGELVRGRPLGLRAWLELLGEPLRPHPPGPRSAHDFVRQRLGPRAADALADLLTRGIYGAPARAVGFEAAFPELAAALGRHGSLARLLWKRRRGGERPVRPGLISAEVGLDALPRALAAALGEQLECGARLTGLQVRPGGFELELAGAPPLRARRLVLALPPAPLAELFARAPDIARLARDYRPVPQTLTSFALADAELCARFHGFGFLAPPREELPLIGALCASALFPGRAPPGTLLVTVFAAPALLGASDAELDAAIGPALARLLGSSAKPELLDVARHPQGIWLYDRRQPARTAVLRSRLRALGIEIAGAAYDGIAMGAALRSGLAAARALAADPFEGVSRPLGARPTANSPTL